MAKGDICHIELHSTDFEATRAFYEKAFGWTFEIIPGFDSDSILFQDVNSLFVCYVLDFGYLYVNIQYLQLFFACFFNPIKYVLNNIFQVLHHSKLICKCNLYV